MPQEVVIRSNSYETTLTINAANDTVNHYGQLLEANIQKVSTSSYYEHGDANLVEIASGRLVITNDSTTNIDNIYLNATSDEYKVNNVGIILATENGAKLPNIVRRDAVNETSGKIVCTIQTNVDEEGKNPEKTEVVTIQGDDKVAEKDNGYVNATDLAEMVFEAPNGCTDTGATPYIGKEVAVSSADKTAVVNEAKGTVVAVTFGGKTDTLTLTEFRNAWNAGTYFSVDSPASVVLTGNADMKKIGNWGPIGTWEYPFNGTFDGQNHTIDNLSNHANADADGNYTHVYSENQHVGYGETYGFFGIVGGCGTLVTIENINFTNVNINIENGKNVGALIGFAPKNSYFKDSSLDNDVWKNSATIGTSALTVSNVSIGNENDNSSVAAKTHVGGLIGKYYASNNLTIENCKNYAKVTSQKDDGAGLVCYIAGTTSDTTVTVTNSENHGDITSPGSTYVSGLINVAVAKLVKIHDCKNTGNVTNTSTAASNTCASGICYIDASVELYNLENTGDIKCNVMAAGIMGSCNNDKHTVKVGNQTEKTILKNTGTIESNNASAIFGKWNQVTSGSVFKNVSVINTGSIKAKVSGGILFASVNFNNNSSTQMPFENVDINNSGSISTSSDNCYEGIFVGKYQTGYITLKNFTITNTGTFDKTQENIISAPEDGTSYVAPHIYGTQYNYMQGNFKNQHIIGICKFDGYDEKSYIQVSVNGIKYNGSWLQDVEYHTVTSSNGWAHTEGTISSHTEN